MTQHLFERSPAFEVFSEADQRPWNDDDRSFQTKRKRFFPSLNTFRMFPRFWIFWGRGEFSQSLGVTTLDFFWLFLFETFVSAKETFEMLDYSFLEKAPGLWNSKSSFLRWQWLLGISIFFCLNEAQVAGWCLSDFSLPSWMGGPCRRSFWAKIVQAKKTVV